MKQSAVEWLENMIAKMEAYGGDLPPLMIHIQKAKEMEKEQQDKFAIGFAEWLIEKEREHSNRIIRMNKLLGIYKKDKGL